MRCEWVDDITHYRELAPSQDDEWEMKRMVGADIFNEYHPDRFYNHDARTMRT